MAPVSPVYNETILKLMGDPIIVKLAKDVSTLPHSEMSRWEFMSAALREYVGRGGKVNTHIGGPADAISHLVFGEGI